MLIITTIIIYLVAKYVKKGSGNIIFIISFVVLSSLNIYRLLTDYGGWVMDISVPLMVFVCKWTYYGY